MRAFAYTTAHNLSGFQIRETELPEPRLKPQDVLVRIKAFSFNPADYKIRQTRSAATGEHVVIGWDAAGVVEKVGNEVQGFATGDEVYYSGDLTRDGSYAELQAVDHRIIAKKPATLSFAEAAALPLTALTAWEALFERGFEYTPETRVLIIGGAGGVGSIAIQLLKANTPATVIATASRPDTMEWTKQMGADHVIGRDLEAELKNIGIDSVDIIFGTTHTSDYLEIIPKLLRPFGSLCIIDDPDTLDIVSFKRKALSVHWEFMFAKSMHHYKPEQQGQFLATLANQVDAGKIHSTLNLSLKASEAEVEHAHRLLEDGKAIGKIAMEW